MRRQLECGVTSSRHCTRQPVQGCLDWWRWLRTSVSLLLLASYSDNRAARGSAHPSLRVLRAMSRRFQEPSFSLPTSISSQCLYSGHLQLNLTCSGIQLRNARRCCEIRPAAGTSILEALNGMDKRGLCQMQWTDVSRAHSEDAWVSNK